MIYPIENGLRYVKKICTKQRDFHANGADLIDRCQGYWINNMSVEILFCSMCTFGNLLNFNILMNF